MKWRVQDMFGQVIGMFLALALIAGAMLWLL